jgi:hypothetical protein
MLLIILNLDEIEISYDTIHEPKMNGDLAFAKELSSNCCIWR